MAGAKKRLTMSQLAQLAGTSKSTVSRVLTNNPHVSAKTRRRVEEIIREYEFQPNLFARGLRGGRTGQIAVIGRWMERGFFTDAVKGMDRVATRNDAHLLVCLAHSADDYISLWRNFAKGGQVDGTMLVAPPLSIFSQQVEPEDVPAVLCAASSPRSRKGWKNVDSVTLDNKRAMRDLLEHLVGQGRRHFVHLAGTADTQDVRERLEGFDAYMAEHSELQGEVLKGASWLDFARRRVLQYLDKHADHPDAFICFNDMIAAGVLSALRERGISVPRDIAVTGFDDVPMSEHVGITTIRVPGFEIGEEAMRLLFMRLDVGEETVVARNTSMELRPLFRSSSEVKESGASPESV